MLETALEVCALLREQLNEAVERLEIQEQLLQKQAEQIALQAEEIQRLKDEISILKGEKPRPKIKPSTLNCDSDGLSAQ